MNQTAPEQQIRENRKHKRVFFAFPVTFTVGDVVFEGQCQRIAGIGMHMFCPMVAEPGTLWGEARFMLPGTETMLTVPARVLRSTVEDPDTGILGGMQLLFGHMTDDAAAAIHDFVGVCLARSFEFKDMEQAETDGDAIPVRFFAADNPSNQYVVNISEGGAFIRTLKPEPVTSIVALDLYLPGSAEVARINGRVAWTRQPESGSGKSGMGLSFFDVPSEVAASLKDFVDNYGVEVA